MILQKERGESLLQLEDYFHKIWNEGCVSIRTRKQSSKYTDQYQNMEELYTSLLEKYNDIETYSTWEKDTEEANKITLIHNGTQGGAKNSSGSWQFQYLSENAGYVIVQTPYVICNGYMYTVLLIAGSLLQIILNAVERSKSMGCTDYLNSKRKILKNGADVYELMNDYPVYTKTVLIDNRLSVVGSYNLDMRHIWTRS